MQFQDFKKARNLQLDMDIITTAIDMEDWCADGWSRAQKRGLQLVTCSVKDDLGESCAGGGVWQTRELGGQSGA
jgi:hypothetical protein